MDSIAHLPDGKVNFLEGIFFSPGLADFPVRLVDSILCLPDGKVNFFGGHFSLGQKRKEI